MNTLQPSLLYTDKARAYRSPRLETTAGVRAARVPGGEGLGYVQPG